MLVLHPNEINLVYEYYTLTDEEFVGPPLVKKAKKIISRRNKVKQL